MTEPKPNQPAEMLSEFLKRNGAPTGEPAAEPPSGTTSADAASETIKFPFGESEVGPASGSEAVEEEPEDGQLPSRDRFDQLVHFANTGDRESLEKLRKVLDDHPEIWQQVGDLGRHAEMELIKLVAGEDRLLGESMNRQLQDMREQLLGTDPAPVEKLAVERVVACWLDVQYVTIRTNRVGDNLHQAKYWSKRQDQASKRYDAAMKMLITLRHLLGRDVGSGEPPRQENGPEAGRTEGETQSAAAG